VFSQSEHLYTSYPSECISLYFADDPSRAQISSTNVMNFRSNTSDLESQWLSQVENTILAYILQANVTSTTYYRPSICGNGVVEYGETCDERTSNCKNCTLDYNLCSQQTDLCCSLEGSRMHGAQCTPWNFSPSVYVFCNLSESWPYCESRSSIVGIFCTEFLSVSYPTEHLHVPYIFKSYVQVDESTSPNYLLATLNGTSTATGRNQADEWMDGDILAGAPFETEARKQRDKYALLSVWAVIVLIIIIVLICYCIRGRPCKPTIYV
jgi:hypothetical protein